MNINYTLTFTIDSENGKHVALLGALSVAFALADIEYTEDTGVTWSTESVEAAAPTDTTPTVEDAVAAAAKYRPSNPFPGDDMIEWLARADNRNVPCPKCQADVGESCVTTVGGKPYGNSFYHYDRMVAWNKKRTS